MRSLAVVLQQMLDVPASEDTRTIRVVLEDVKRNLACDPPEAEPALWGSLAIFLRSWFRNRLLTDTEQRLADIFRGPLKTSHVVELPRDPVVPIWPAHSGPPPMTLPANYVECYCPLGPNHQPGDPIELAGSL